MFLIVGRLSDIFGRRYFMIGGAALGCIGAIICATAKSVPVLVSVEINLPKANH
jgi:MFS family permease